MGLGLGWQQPPASRYGWTHVYCNDAIRLIRKKARGIIHVDNAASREDTPALLGRKQGNGLVDPIVQVRRRRMAPMLVPGHDCRRVVLIIEMPGTIGVSEHAIGVIHEVLWRREVYLGPILASIIANNGSARGHRRAIRRS